MAMLTHLREIIKIFKIPQHRWILPTYEEQIVYGDSSLGTP